jgi:hypothetical protein
VELVGQENLVIFQVLLFFMQEVEEAEDQLNQIRQHQVQEALEAVVLVQMEDQLHKLDKQIRVVEEEELVTKVGRVTQVEVE